MTKHNIQKVCKGLKSSIKDKYTNLIYRSYVPKTRKHSDVYLVAFPKSGITWLSTLIANINLIESQSPQRATYYNIHQFIPDLHISRTIDDEPIWAKPNFRMIKSHMEFCPEYNLVIYLYRNPESVRQDQI